MKAEDLHVERIDWAAWKPTEYANLCFVMREGQILLIRKKRGLGVGKINGPGGRLEKGETALDSAIRETQEGGAVGGGGGVGKDGGGGGGVGEGGGGAGFGDS